jgi:hypothetical protein
MWLNLKTWQVSMNGTTADDANALLKIVAPFALNSLTWLGQLKLNQNF